MTVNQNDLDVARYIDGKADASRRHAKRDPRLAEMHEHTARVLDALSDEIKIGLHHGA